MVHAHTHTCTCVDLCVGLFPNHTAARSRRRLASGGCESGLQSGLDDKSYECPGYTWR